MTEAECPSQLLGSSKTGIRSLPVPTPTDSFPRLPGGSLAEAKASFLQQYENAYGYQGWMDNHWQEEVGNRLGPGQHYLDYTGAAQYTTSMITSIMSELTSCAFGNPHSRNPSSAKSTQEVDLARSLVLQHFNADPDQYYVIFTKGATEGLKMVGEFFPWTGANSSSSSNNNNSGRGGGVSSNFIYTQANHKSVLGIGAYAKRAGAALHCVSREQMDQWLESPGKAIPTPQHMSRQNSSLNLSRRPSVLTAYNSGSYATVTGESGPLPTPADVLASSFGNGAAAGNGTAAAAAAAVTNAEGDGNGNSGSNSTAPTFHLVAFPAKDNYEGQLYPLTWIKQIHAKSGPTDTFLVALDAAAYASTHQLDLSLVKPDFVPISFYKLFGYPTGLGALLVRKEAARQLNKVYFGGGSVDYCTAEDVWHVLSAPPAGLEDGTLGYLNIAALKYGFELLARLGGMKAVANHVECLRAWTYQQLASLQHSNGRPLLKLFGRHAEGPTTQCAIFQFQVVTSEGDRLPGALVEAAAIAAGLHLRTGCNCNPGRCLANLGITPEEERARAAQGHKGPILVVMRPRTSSLGGRLIFDSSNKATPATSDSPFALRPNAPGALNSAVAPAAAQGNAGSFSSKGGLAGVLDIRSSSAAASSRQLVPVPLPLGSVRASLGAMSTFEDCYALVRFLALTFRDFEVSDKDVTAGVKLVNVVNDTEKVVRVRATVSSAGALEQDTEHTQNHHHAAVEDTIHEELDSDDETESMMLYNMLSYAS